MGALLYSLIAVTAASLVSLIGILTLFFRKGSIENITSSLIAVSTGALLGAAFLDLIPEAVEVISVEKTSMFILGGIIAFFAIEKFLFWYHCHDGKCEGHQPLPYLILFGDIFHTFLDGVIIAVAFLTDTALGVVTTFAIIIHEVPHELSDFFVLIHGGFSRTKALFSNLLVAFAHYVGVAVVFLFSIKSEMSLIYLLPFAAGGFIYIAVADLIPELHKDTGVKKAIIQLILMLFGIIITGHLVHIL
jgi:zinc and cadmium transporter